MFNSIVLDVFISLVFLYLLYSLFISILGEMICAWIGLRPRIQRVAMEKMLNDKYYFINNKYTWLKPLAEFFLYEFNEFKGSFAGKFYDHPGIKYLAKEEKKSRISFKNSKPAYFSKEVFSETLVQLFRSKANGQSEFDKIKFALQYNTHHIQPETLSHINELFKDSGEDMKLFRDKLMNWYTETMYRTTGWYKKKLQFILFWLGFIVAMVFNVDSIRITQQLLTDKDARKQMVELGIQASDTNSSIAKALKVTKNSAVSDSLLNKSWNDVKDATEGTNKILGLGWGFDQMSKKSTLTLEVSKGTADLLESRFFSSVNRYKNSVAISEKAISFTTEKRKKDSLLVRLKIQHDSLQLFMALTNQAILNLRGGCFHISSAKFVTFDSNPPVEKKGHPDIIIVNVSGSRTLTFGDKIWFMISSSFPWDISFWGFFITALMLSLGAPFWFDLLKKLISIRSSGVKPEEKEQGTTTEGEKMLPIQPAVAKGVETPKETNPLEEALHLFTRKIQHENGLVSVGIKTISTSPFGSIEVQVEEAGMITHFQNLYGNKMKDGDNPAVNVNYSASDRINSQEGAGGGEIANSKVPSECGTLGCYLQKKGSQEHYLLSCWHVLKDDYYWDRPAIFKEIIDNQNNVIATIEEGCISDTLDIGIALCNQKNDFSNKHLPIKRQQRAVTPYDALVETPVILVGKVCDRVEATILSHNTNAVLNYPGENVKRIIYDTFSIARIDSDGNATPVTYAGDSGAVVVDKDFTPLGMIIGSGNNVSYAIKFTNAFDPDKLYRDYLFLTT
ncbi:MAG: hypothetical protein WCL00_03105 [Bacteroidota bacterium]